MDLDAVTLGGGDAFGDLIAALGDHRMVGEILAVIQRHTAPEHVGKDGVEAAGLQVRHRFLPGVEGAGPGVVPPPAELDGAGALGQQVGPSQALPGRRGGVHGCGVVTGIEPRACIRQARAPGLERFPGRLRVGRLGEVRLNPRRDCVGAVEVPDLRRAVERLLRHLRPDVGQVMP